MKKEIVRINSITIKHTKGIINVGGRKGFIEIKKDKTKAIAYIGETLSLLMDPARNHSRTLVNNVINFSITFKQGLKLFNYEVGLNRCIITREVLYELKKNKKEQVFFKSGYSYKVNEKYIDKELNNLLLKLKGKYLLGEKVSVYHMLSSLSGKDNIINKTFEALRYFVIEHFSHLGIKDHLEFLTYTYNNEKVLYHYDDIKNRIVKHLESDGIVDIVKFNDSMDFTLSISFIFKNGDSVDLFKLPGKVYRKFYLYWLILTCKYIRDSNLYILDDIDIGMKEKDSRILIKNVKSLCEDLNVNLIYSKV